MASRRWLPNLAASMLTKEGEAQLAIHHLEQTYAVTSNPETRAEIGRKLAALRGQQSAAELAAGAEALRKLVDENYPFAPEAFSIVAGPRVPPGVDLPALLAPGPAPAEPSP